MSKTNSAWGKKNKLITNSNQNRVMRNKNKSKNSFLPSLSSSQSQLYSKFSLPPLCPAVQGHGEWGLWSVWHRLPLLLLLPLGEDSSHCSPCSSVGTIPQETVHHFPNTSPFHMFQFFMKNCGSLSTAAVLLWHLLTPLLHLTCLPGKSGSSTGHTTWLKLKLQSYCLSFL